MNQIYTIATKTKLDIKGLKIADHLNDQYFRRQKLKKPKHTEGEIFDTQKEVKNFWQVKIFFVIDTPWKLQGTLNQK